ncbi:MAG: hypothetical protein IIB57_01800 [Planctomycetes bacterium]|nr:hypothetical protein [Planctomycetota bacterium]
MFGQGRPRHTGVCILLSALLASIAGCVTPFARRPAPIVEPAVSRAAPTSTTPAYAPKDDRERATLSAVEEFLARTETYRLTAEEESESQELLPRSSVSVATEPRVDRASEQEVSVDAAGLVPVATGKSDQAMANTQIALTDGNKTEPALAIPVVLSVSIRVPESSPIHEAKSSAEKTTNTPLEVEADAVPVTADRFIRHLKTVSERDGDIDSAWRLRLVQQSLGYEPDGFDEAPMFSAETARLFSSLLHVIHAVSALARDPLATGEETVQHLTALQELVADRADPIVETIALCRRVVTFGVYDEMSDNEFVTGHPIPTIVYSEIRNFQSKATTDGTYETVFATRIDILTADGRPVWQREEPEIIDRCRRRRQDFFIAQRITIPATLTPGNYVLKLMVEDRLSSRVSEATRAFTISAPDMRTAER